MSIYLLAIALEVIGHIQTDMFLSFVPWSVQLELNMVLVGQDKHATTLLLEMNVILCTPSLFYHTHYFNCIIHFVLSQVLGLVTPKP